MASLLIAAHIYFLKSQDRSILGDLVRQRRTAFRDRRSQIILSLNGYYFLWEEKLGSDDTFRDPTSHLIHPPDGGRVDLQLRIPDM